MSDLILRCVSCAHYYMGRCYERPPKVFAAVFGGPIEAQRFEYTQERPYVGPDENSDRACGRHVPAPIVSTMRVDGGRP